MTLADKSAADIPSHCTIQRAFRACELLHLATAGRMRVELEWSIIP